MILELLSCLSFESSIFFSETVVILRCLIRPFTFTPLALSSSDYQIFFQLYYRSSDMSTSPYCPTKTLETKTKQYQSLYIFLYQTTMLFVTMSFSNTFSLETFLKRLFSGKIILICNAFFILSLYSINNCKGR